MQCPKCRYENTKVIDSRSSDDGKAIRRRRECEKCNFRFTTFERTSLLNLLVKKNNHTCEAFDREKLKKGILLSCGKRPVTSEQIEQLISSLEEKFAGKKEISAREIGEEVMLCLKELDHIAFIRFASVYRSFRDIEEFKKELSLLFEKKK